MSTNTPGKNFNRETNNPGYAGRKTIYPARSLGETFRRYRCLAT